tara:strand:+ start:1072 stop:1551 length:480 start_codon:yes stop_codon:yes gene_type:complete
MNTKFLLSSKFKKYGWLILIPGVVLGILYMIFDIHLDFLSINVFAISFDESTRPNRELFGFIEDNILNEVLGLFIIIGGLMVAFSKEYDEDEFISRMRLESLVWAILWNYGLLAIAFILFYESSFLSVMVYSMFTPLILFILRFNWLIWKSRKSVKHEE